MCAVDFLWGGQRLGWRWTSAGVSWRRCQSGWETVLRLRVRHRVTEGVSGFGGRLLELTDGRSSILFTALAGSAGLPEGTPGRSVLDVS